VPFTKETVSPSGGAPALEVTAAVKVTACPYMDGFGEDESAVVVVGSSTTCFTVFDVLLEKVESPAYFAVVESVPSGSDDVVKLAEPPLNDPVPSTVVPFMNDTVSPSGGAPALEVITAVKVTACP
jgi:predicted small secreted protein